MQMVCRITFMLCIVKVLWAVSCEEGGAGDNGKAIRALFIFGDSLADVGNNNYLPLSGAKANFPHNGVDFPHAKPTGRFTNGFNSADFLAEKVGLGRLSPPPYLSLHGIHSLKNFTGANFASGGSGILNQTGESAVQRIPLSKQVQDFAKLHGSLLSLLGQNQTEELVNKKSLFVFVVGSNDIFSYSTIARKQTPKGFVDLLVSTLKAELQKLYSLGARKVLFAGAGPVGCCPKERLKNKHSNASCDQQDNELAMEFNKQVYSMLCNMSAVLSDFTFAFGDTYFVVSQYIQNPQAFGLKNGVEACCGGGRLNAEIPCLPFAKYCRNRNEYVFWDKYHPTQKVIEMLVTTFFNASDASAVRPFNVSHLISSP